MVIVIAVSFYFLLALCLSIYLSIYFSPSSVPSFVSHPHSRYPPLPSPPPLHPILTTLPQIIFIPFHVPSIPCLFPLPFTSIIRAPRPLFFPLHFLPRRKETDISFINSAPTSGSSPSDTHTHLFPITFAYRR